MGLIQQLALALFDEPAGGTPAAARPAPPPKAPAPPPVNPVASVNPVSPVGPQARREIRLQGQAVPYTLRRARRRTIGFVVGPEGLSVSAPRWVGLGEIESALAEKGPWILRKLQEQGERQRRLEATRIRWADGESIPYLGLSVVLQLGASAEAPLGGTGSAQLELDESGRAARLRLGLPADAQAERIRDTVHAWWQRQARRVFEERCALYAPRLGVKLRELRLSAAQTRWGSASADGTIRLNWRLIQFPIATVDYVVVHELAHLREMNHSPAFWEVVRTVLPAYEQAQAPLKQAVPLGD